MGVVHAVIERQAPGTPVVDLTHSIAAHDVWAGALTLWRSVPWITPGVILAVVDPGVGTARRAVAVRATSGDVLVGPDNGLLFPALQRLGGAEAAVELETDRSATGAPGATFAGRDVFAPAAARAASGSPLHRLGRPIDPATLTGRPLPEAVLDDDGRTWRAEVLWIDRFGNAQINLAAAALGAGGVWRVRLDGGGQLEAPVVGSYGEIGEGQVALVVDSYGLLALSADRASAADALDLAPGQVLGLCPETPVRR